MMQDSFDPAEDPDGAWRKTLDEVQGCSRHDDDAVLARVKARVMRSIGAGQRTVRAAQGQWSEIGPGIERKWLWNDGATESWMVRLAPGAVVRAPLHAAVEECVVLQGSLRIGAGLVLHQGDFHVAASGTLHEAVSTDTGALLYIRGAPTEDALP
jgi:anti-sigma factor ChrR (cupin superfamily)